VRAFQLLALAIAARARDAEGRLCVELLSGNLPRRVSAVGASFPFPPAAAEVG